jgi:Domain of unknown function (DUF929)
MGKSDRTRSQAARQRIVAQQAAARRAQARRRLLITGGSVAAVLALVVAIVVVALDRTPPKAGPAIVSAALAARVTHVSPATFDAIGPGSASGLRAISGQPKLSLDGKPEVLYIGGEFCPWCAAERWAIAAALSRFGQLSGLHFIHSSPTEAYPDTPTLSFYKSGFTSRYVSFVPVEWYGEAVDSGTPFGHAYLQQPTKAETVLFDRYASGSFPFLDIANRYLLPATSYLPSALTGLTWSQVAADMHDPGSTVGRDIDGAANIIAMAICSVTGGQPGSVCHSAGVVRARGSL